MTDGPKVGRIDGDEDGEAVVDESEGRNDGD